MGYIYSGYNPLTNLLGNFQKDIPSYMCLIAFGILEPKFPKVGPCTPPEVERRVPEKV